jgi:hypothetical protein
MVLNFLPACCLASDLPLTVEPRFRTPLSCRHLWLAELVDAGQVQRLAAAERAAQAERAATAEPAAAAERAAAKRSTYRGKLRGESVDLPDVEIRRITYRKRNPADTAALRRVFDSSPRLQGNYILQRQRHFPST